MPLPAFYLKETSAHVSMHAGKHSSIQNAEDSLLNFCSVAQVGSVVESNLESDSPQSIHAKFQKMFLLLGTPECTLDDPSGLMFLFYVLIEASRRFYRILDSPGSHDDIKNCDTSKSQG